MSSSPTVVLDCHSPATNCNYNRDTTDGALPFYCAHTAGLGELTLREKVEGSVEPLRMAAGWPSWSAAGQQALNGWLLLQETFRDWEAFIWLRSQGCFSKDFQVFLSSWQWLVNPIQAPSEVAGIPGYQHQMTDRQEQGSCPRKKTTGSDSLGNEGHCTNTQMGRF